MPPPDGRAVHAQQPCPAIEEKVACARVRRCQSGGPSHPRAAGPPFAPAHASPAASRASTLLWLRPPSAAGAVLCAHEPFVNAMALKRFVIARTGCVLSNGRVSPKPTPRQQAGRSAQQVRRSGRQPKRTAAPQWRPAAPPQTAKESTRSTRCDRQGPARARKATSPLRTATVASPSRRFGHARAGCVPPGAAGTFAGHNYPCPGRRHELWLAQRQLGQAHRIGERFGSSAVANRGARLLSPTTAGTGPEDIPVCLCSSGCLPSCSQTQSVAATRPTWQALARSTFGQHATEEAESKQS